MEWLDFVEAFWKQLAGAGFHFRRQDNLPACFDHNDLVLVDSLHCVFFA